MKKLKLLIAVEVPVGEGQLFTEELESAVSTPFKGKRKIQVRVPD
jgi:hypothetical protein